MLNGLNHDAYRSYCNRLLLTTLQGLNSFFFCRNVRFNNDERLYVLVMASRALKRSRRHAERRLREESRLIRESFDEESGLIRECFDRQVCVS